MFPVYQKEFEQLINEIMDEHLLKKQNASVKFDSKKSHSTLANYPITKEGLLGNKFLPNLLLDYLLKAIVPICMQRRNWQFNVFFIVNKNSVNYYRGIYLKN